MLTVGALTGQVKLLASGQSHILVETRRLEVQDIGSEPKLVKVVRPLQIDSRYQQQGNSLEFVNRSLRSGLLSADGEVLALLATNDVGGIEAILAVGRRQGIDDQRKLSGEYLLRSFYIALGDAAMCVAENRRGNLRFGDDGQWRARASVHRAEWDFKQPLFREAAALPRDVQGTYRVAADGHLAMSSGGIEWKGFVAKNGRLLVLAESDGAGYGLVLAVKVPERPTEAQLTTTHRLLGASLEFEGRPHLAPVVIRGKIAYLPTRHAFDAAMEKLKWPGFPHPQSFARETLTIRPKGQHRVADNGTFGPEGDGSDWHLIVPELGLSIYMMDFDIFSAQRAESVRGMIIGLGTESQQPRRAGEKPADE
ncbi:MAG: hypothetical protein WD063_04715 [Pirellulales bacterium]